MKFEESELIAASMIGFDMIEGPMIKWFRQFQECNFQIDMENFLMNFYLSFRGGDEALQPIAILYRGFYIVAFPRGLELCCLFMRPGDLSIKLNRLGQIANELITQMDANEEIESGEKDSSNTQDYDEIKRIVVNLLRGRQMSTPELRRHFKLSNSEIWEIMSQLEESKTIIRTQKVGRAQFWMAVV